jgi:hypothetical protein
MRSQAQDWIARARELDPHCRLLSRAENAIAAGAEGWDAKPLESLQRTAREPIQHAGASRRTRRSLVWALLLLLVVLGVIASQVQNERSAGSGAHKGVGPDAGAQ